jgi:hypothetical protein
MQRQAAIATMLLLVGISGCADRVPTSPDITAASAAPLLQAGRGGLTLHPSGFGEHSYAAWKAKEGQPDDRGNGDHALYFQKMTTTATFAAAIAIIEGLEGMPASALTASVTSGLSWEHRIDGHCGAGAPRWNVGVTGPTGQRRTVFLGCAAAAKSPGSAPGWIRDSYPGPAIEAQIIAQTGFPSLVGVTLRGLAIVYDEGIDCCPPGFVFLDNITVTVGATPHVFTGPMDNGR